ncbi:hypothetical protein O2V63_15635 [Modestobacter sp. VKM Ac-2977]|uniref:hypothetical protein n=1 Tax=Modestobacter sp. VKM Ac-2977 TaxID=3004131 RepID=UPI0022AA40C3|nr:hypothetical protein [Modestobacter sp. VKM Ac-2977]MCZ2821777.1 hypothetical protein [Modestobacter sp. VKM Ac-2977]
MTLDECSRSSTRSPRAAGDPRLAHLLDVAAVLVALPRRPAVSHASAAAVHGLLVPCRGLTEVRLTDPYNWRVGRGYRVSQGGLPARAVAGWGPRGFRVVRRPGLTGGGRRPT